MCQLRMERICASGQASGFAFIYFNLASTFVTWYPCTSASTSRAIVSIIFNMQHFNQNITTPQCRENWMDQTSSATASHIQSTGSLGWSMAAGVRISTIQWPLKTHSKRFYSSQHHEKLLIMLLVESSGIQVLPFYVILLWINGLADCLLFSSSMIIRNSV